MNSYQDILFWLQLTEPSRIISYVFNSISSCDEANKVVKGFYSRPPAPATRVFGVTTLALLAANYLGTSDDAYPWTKCNHFEATKKNCPRGEKCLKMNRFSQPSGPFSYAWNWAMRCTWLQFLK